MRGTTKDDHAVHATVLDEMFAEFALEAFHLSANAHHGYKVTARGITPNGQTKGIKTIFLRVSL
jgi:hypothetical protein